MPKTTRTKRTPAEKKTTKTVKRTTTKKKVTGKKTATKSSAASKDAPTKRTPKKPKTTPREEVSIERRTAGDRRKPSERRQKSEPVAVERRQIERRAKVSRRRQIDPTTCERDYNEAELEFMTALDTYKRTSGRMFPTCSEILEVLKDLGYEKRPPIESSSEDQAEPPNTATEADRSVQDAPGPQTDAPLGPIVMPETQGTPVLEQTA